MKQKEILEEILTEVRYIRLGITKPDLYCDCGNYAPIDHDPTCPMFEFNKRTIIGRE